jgi:DNA-binding NarL/FixJ family response regulator
MAETTRAVEAVEAVEAVQAEVVGTAMDARELSSKVLALRPDVVISDIEMPPHSDDDGLQTALKLRRQIHELPVILLSQHLEPRFALAVVSEDANAVGYAAARRRCRRSN